VREASRTSAMAIVKQASSKLNLGMTKASSLLSRSAKKKSYETKQAEPTSDEQEDFDVMERRASLSSNSLGSSCSSENSGMSSRGLSSWRQIPNLQSGHLYIRVDDFGPHAGSWGDSRSSRNEEMKSFLRRKPNENMLPLKHANLRMQVEWNGNKAGDLLFQEGVPRIKMPKNESSLGPFGHRVIRMSSMPNLQQKSGTTSDDVRWANQWIMFTPGAKLPMKPPSAVALQILLEHYDPISVQLYGKAHFKTMQEFYEELRTLKSFLVLRNNNIQRCLESVVLET